MPVVALTEKGLVIDVFGQKPLKMNSEMYKTSNNKLVSVYNNQLRLMDLLSPKDFIDCAVSSCSELFLSPDGEKCAVKDFNDNVTVFLNRKELRKLSAVKEFSISNGLFGCVMECSLQVFSFYEEKPVFESRDRVKKVYCFGTFTIALAEKDKSQSIILVRGSSAQTLLDLPEIFGLTIETSPSESSCLILVDVEYSKNSYYAVSELYFLRFVHPTNSSNPSSVSTTNGSAPEMKKPSEMQKPPVGKKTEDGEKSGIKLVLDTGDIIFSLFKSLKRVLFFKYLEERFYVCFGVQPACLHMYSKEGVFVRDYPKTIRNQTYFSRDGTRVINAGLGNLPGNIEVLCNGKVTCSFESLGASTVSWLPDDTHFMVATTNYFKSDNRVCVYDYHGRATEVLECLNLSVASVYGNPERPLELQPPAVKMVPERPAAYVPPHLQASDIRTQSIRGQLEAKDSPTEHRSQKTLSPKKAHARTREEIEKELDECIALKKCLAAGDDLTADEQTRVFSIKQLQEELDKMDQ